MYKRIAMGLMVLLFDCGGPEADELKVNTTTPYNEGIQYIVVGDGSIGYRAYDLPEDGLFPEDADGLIDKAINCSNTSDGVLNKPATEEEIKVLSEVVKRHLKGD